MKSAKPYANGSVQNLLDVYAVANDVDLYLGRTFYPIARDIVRDWAIQYDVKPATVACVIAATSPQTEWTRNLEVAEDILARRPVSRGNVLYHNVNKATRMLYDATDSMAPYYKFAPKVCNFALNLQGSDSNVTIDAHAVQAYVNDETEKRCARNWDRYNAIAGAYGLAAKIVGRKPAEFQSIVWHIWKRLHTPEQKRAEIARRKLTAETINASASI